MRWLRGSLRSHISQRRHLRRPRVLTVDRTFLLGVGAIVVGAAAMLIVRTRFPGFFQGGRDVVIAHPAAPAHVTHVTVTEN